jgi:hypothetical protein
VILMWGPLPDVSPSVPSFPPVNVATPPCVCPHFFQITYRLPLPLSPVHSPSWYVSLPPQSPPPQHRSPFTCTPALHVAPACVLSIPRGIPHPMSQLPFIHHHPHHTLIHVCHRGPRAAVQRSIIQRRTVQLI